MATLKRPITGPVIRGKEWTMARSRPKYRLSGARRQQLAEQQIEPEQPAPEPEKKAAKKTTKKAT